MSTGAPHRVKGPEGRLRATGFEKIDRDLRFLMECFREVLRELGEDDLSDWLPWVSARRAAGPHRLSDRACQAFSIAFQLLNMVEENAAAQTRRARETECGPEAEPGLWAHQLAELRAQGIEPKEIARFLPQVRVEPVLTAHPTEAKRATVLELHRALYLHLLRRENQMFTEREQAAHRNEIKAALEQLWRTGEILVTKPEIATERRVVMHHLTQVFPTVLEDLDRRFLTAWRETGWDADLVSDPGAWPKLRFGTWVGGDRDGHPLVTAEVTATTLQELRAHALLVLHRKITSLAGHLTLSRHFQPPPAALEKAVDRMRRDLGERGTQAARWHEEEPWRQMALLMQAKLPIQLSPGDNGVTLRHGPGSYARPAELLRDLDLLQRSLRAVGADRIASECVVPVRRAVDVFGFHLAVLDIRQNSTFHDLAMDQLLAAAGADDSHFSTWPEERRLAFLDSELRCGRPFTAPGAKLGPEARAVLECYRAVAEHIERFGADGVGALIVSMTRQLSDLLVVFLFAREAGLATWSKAGLSCSLPVTPLFETVDDLERSRSILAQFLAHPVCRRSVPPQPGGSGRVQQVMLGYSDSNKESGILASQWALHQAQADLTDIARKHRCQLRFFHGRGGTISRGAGPTHRFLEALPGASLLGDMRMTEQGETIQQKYANLGTAAYNLELLLAGVCGVSLRHLRHPVSDAGLRELMEPVAEWSRAVFHDLMKADGFLAFYTEATPIDALELSAIGSRPARRRAQRTLSDLRAIPWVFSWTQSRFYLPGWFGVGSALERLAQTDSKAFRRLREAARSHPFLKFTLTNVETNLASADPDQMTAYASLVSDGSVRDRFVSQILGEFHRSAEMLSALFGAPLGERRPRMLKTLQLRADALRLLHDHQCILLREWRAARAAGRDDQAAAMRPALLLSINAIASGLRTTG